MCGWMEELKNKRMENGWMDGWMDAWMDAWMHACMHI